MSELLDKISAVVIGFDSWQADTNQSFGVLREEMKLAKAGVLYADDVTLASQATTTAFRVLDETVEDQESDLENIGGLLSSLDEEGQAGLFELADGLGRECIVLADGFQTAFLMAQWVDGILPSNRLPLMSEASVRAFDPTTFQSGYARFARSAEGRARLEELEAMARSIEDDQLRAGVDEFIAEEKLIRSGAEPRFDPFPTAPRQSVEAALLTGVLGGLPAFPDADWDVILDVRERLEPSRVSFRAAISTAADDLKNCERPEDLARACASLKRQKIDPAISQIDVELEDLGAVDTLLRVGSEAPVVGGVATNLALFATDPVGLGLSALMHGALAAPMFASGMREWRYRREKRRELAARPFWLLREIDRESS